MAPAAAAAYESGTGTGTWTVHVPGGTLTVILQQHTAFLRGPDVFVADGDIRGDW